MASEKSLVDAANEKIDAARKVVRAEEVDYQHLDKLIRHKFTIDHTDPVTNVRYEGEFECILPNLDGMVRMGQLRSDIIGNRMVDLGTQEMAVAMADCKVCLTKSPEWFDMTKIHDVSLLFKVYKEVANHRAQYFPENRGGGQPQKDREAGVPEKS